MRVLGPLLAVLLLAACSSIQIDEADVFEPKASITPETFSHETATLEEVTIYSGPDSLALNAWWVTQPDAEATVLFFGGQGFYLVQSAPYVEAFAELPVNVLMVDYRGYGKSEGTPSVDALKQDAGQALAYLEEAQGIAPASVIVHGHSLGSFVALHLAEGQDLRGVVLENPVTNVQDWSRNLIPWFLRLFVSLDFSEALRAENNTTRIQSLERPLLIVAGAEDEVTPLSMAETLYEQAHVEDKRLLVVDEGGHNGLMARPSVRDAYRAFIAGLQ